MKRFFLLLILWLNALIMLLYNTPSLCQSQQDYTFKRFFTEGKDLINYTPHRPSSDWIKLSLVAGGTIALMQLDESVRTLMLEHRSESKNVIANISRYWGEPYTSAGIAAIFLVHGISTDNTENIEIGFETAQSYFYSVAVTSILKVSFGRARPRTGANAFTYQPFSFKGDDYFAFPSAHSAGAFSLSTVLASHIKSDILKGAIYIPAFMTAFSRMYENHHWLSDTFAGAFIGYWMGTYFTNLHDKQQMEDPAAPPAQLISFQIMF